VAGSAEPLPPPQQQQQQEEQHTTYTSETEGDGEGGGEGDGEGGGTSEAEARTGSAEPVAAPPAPPAALAAAAGPRGNKKASPPAAPECTQSLSGEPTDSQSTQSTAIAPAYRSLAAVSPSSQGSVKIRRHCAGPNTAHLIPDVVDSRLRAEDWLCVPFNELAKQYKVQCTKCSFTFDITREAAERQYKEMHMEAGGHALLKL